VSALGHMSFSPFLPLLDLIPVGHVVTFNKRVFIKAELSKTKIAHRVFFLGIPLQKSPFQPQVRRCCNTYDNIQTPNSLWRRWGTVGVDSLPTLAIRYY